MALFNESRLRELAKSRATRTFDSVPDALQKRMTASAGRSGFDIFLSHSYLDKELVLGINEYLEGLGYVVYVDWKEDSHLNRDNVTKATAETVRTRINQSKSLFFATTDGARASKWMPWELGYMDGRKSKSAILPVTQNSSGNSYKGQEYLGIYPYVTEARDTEERERLWIHENAEKYVSFEAWLNGTQPHLHG